MLDASIRKSDDAGGAAFSFSKNNFDLIRLIAAAEVAIRHTMVHVAPKQFVYPLEVLFALVPGVPIFFFLSGFLISRSWERSPSASEYFRNRALRLFPALWTCIAFAVALLFLSGYMSTVEWQASRLLMWMVGQGTVFQFWTPEFLRGFGVGAVNGSLWSISVEIQFYIVTALMYFGIRRLSPIQQTVAIGLLALFFSIFNGQREAAEVIIERATGSWVLTKLYGVSFIPWYYMFLCGALAQRMSSWLVPLCIDHAPKILVMYVVAMLIDFHFWGVRLGNDIPPYLVPIMGVAVLSLAYVRPTLGHQVLRGNDVSYGLYIYHMPMVGVLIQFGLVDNLTWVSVALTCSFACAICSWRFVERPFLRRKRIGLRAVAA